ncbi:MAG TPA: ATP-binding protein [Draconibacterium sp.]|nr:ATP-binding protein [Draconibacterium sp.]
MNIITEKFISFYNQSEDTMSLSSNAVLLVTKDAEGKIWAGTNDGLNVYLPKAKTFYPIKVEGSLSSNSISSIESVKPGEIWVSTKHGIIQITYTWNDEKPKFNINYFFTVNGLISNSYTDRSSCASTDNLIYFAGDEGVDFFNTSEVSKLEIPASKTVITEITIDGEKFVPGIDSSGQYMLRLNYHNRMVMFRFTSLDFINSEQQKFRYKLENFSKTWIYPQNEHVATFTNLKQGHYTLVVESSDQNGRWTNPKASIQITVIPPFWETVPFYISMFFIIVLLIYIIFRIRFRAIRKNQVLLETMVKERTQELQIKNAMLEDANQTKNKFFSIISHDLKSPFSGVVGILKILNTPEKIKPEMRDKYISLAYKSAENTYNLLENLLIWSRTQADKIDLNPKNINLSDLITTNIDLLKETARQKDIEIKGIFPTKVHIVADENMINTVIRNLLSNAIKFSYTGSSVLIEVKEKDQIITVSIADSGVGIKDSQLENLFTAKMNRETGTLGESGTGLGLLICREFVHLNGGSLWATQNHPAGTVMHFTIPKNKKVE